MDFLLKFMQPDNDQFIILKQYNFQFKIATAVRWFPVPIEKYTYTGKCHIVSRKI